MSKQLETRQSRSYDDVLFGKIESGSGCFYPFVVSLLALDFCAVPRSALTPCPLPLLFSVLLFFYFLGTWGTHDRTFDHRVKT